MAFGVENGGDSGTPAGRPLPYLKHALPARQENVQSGVTFTATWEFVPATSTVRYRYESATEGRDLPTELKAASDAIYNVGSDVKAPDVLGNTYEEKNDAGLKLGTWTMTGWEAI